MIGVDLTDEEKRARIAEACGIHICIWCRHEIDPDCCHCGGAMDKHTQWDGHSPVPAGCTCGYHEADKMRAETLPCPDYMHDAEAMADAINALPVLKQAELQAHLVRISPPDILAEAFLLALASLPVHQP